MQTFADPEAELIAMCLASGQTSDDAFAVALSLGVTAQSFADRDLGAIFHVMAEAEREGRPTHFSATLFALPETLRERAQRLRRDAHVTLNPAFFVAEIMERIWQRQTVMRLNDLRRLVESRRGFDPTDPVRAEISRVMEEIVGGASAKPVGPKKLAAVLDGEVPKIEQDIVDHAAGKSTGIATGIVALDRLTSGGMKRGSVNVFAGRTGMGKTTLGLNIAHHAATQGHAVCYFTVEMPAGQLARKLLSFASAIKGSKIMIGALTPADMDTLMAAVRSLYEKPIWIDDTFRSSFESFELSCRKLKRRGMLDVIVVDYIQQLTLKGHFQTKQALVTEVSHRVKQLALDLDIAVVALAQFNRDAEKDGEPSIWQVKDSGAVEQDADLGVCIFRDDAGKYWLKVDKNRWGRDRTKFLIDADLSVNAFRNASINLPEDF